MSRALWALVTHSREIRTRNSGTVPLSAVGGHSFHRKCRPIFNNSTGTRWTGSETLHHQVSRPFIDHKAVATCSICRDPSEMNKQKTSPRYVKTRTIVEPCGAEAAGCHSSMCQTVASGDVDMNVTRGPLRWRLTADCTVPAVRIPHQSGHDPINVVVKNIESEGQ